jgi:hypothetical protein
VGKGEEDMRTGAEVEGLGFAGACTVGPLPVLPSYRCEGRASEGGDVWEGLRRLSKWLPVF